MKDGEKCAECGKKLKVKDGMTWHMCPGKKEIVKHDPGCTGTKPETLCEGCLEGLREREKLWQEYTDLLGEEIDSMVGVAYVHHWRSDEARVKKGKELRKKLGIEKEGDS